MKQAKINYIIAAAAIGCFTLLAVIVPPVNIVGQINKGYPVDTVEYAKYRSDSLGLEAVKFLGDVEKEKLRVDSLNKAVQINKKGAEDVSRWVKALVNKSRNNKQQYVKYIPLSVPVQADPVVEKPIVVNLFHAPKYEGTKTRTHQTYLEWKHSRGLFQKKDSLTYIKKVYGK